MPVKAFDELKRVFNENRFRLFMIGGTSRDYLLKIDVLDFDFVTDATPNDMKKFLPEANYRFEKYGSVRLKMNGVHVDITTLRKESKYLDNRHPSEVIFTKKLEEDYIRRDFTINAIYIDENYKIVDFCSGISDLNNKIIRFIGNPEERIKEDPLRILRGERFAKRLAFLIEENTLKAMEKYRYLLDYLNQEKIREENAKSFK